MISYQEYIRKESNFCFDPNVDLLCRVMLIQEINLVTSLLDILIDMEYYLSKKYFNKINREIKLLAHQAYCNLGP